MDHHLASGLTITGLLLALLHWLPWRRKLHRLTAYGMGLGAVLIGQAVWLGLTIQLARIAAFYAVGGFVVMATYAYDWQANARIRMQQANDERQKD
jgi:hypothetical protein